MSNKLREIPEEEIDKILELEPSKIESDFKRMSPLKIVRVTVGLILLVIIGMSFVIYRKDLNFDNLNRLWVKIKYSISNELVNSERIYFDIDSKNKYGIYKNGFCVLSSNSLKIYDESGYQLSDINMVFNYPYLEISDKYILAYDKNAAKLSITDSFKTVFTKSFSGNILDAKINGRGEFITLTAEENYTGLITFFDKDFKEAYKIYYSDRYVTGMALSESGKEIAVSAVYPENGEIKAKLSVYKVGIDTVYAEYDIGEDIPVKVGFKENGNIFVLNEKSVMFFDDSAKLINKINFDGKKLISASDNSPQHTAVTLGIGKKDTNSVTTVYDSRGKAVDIPNPDSEILSLDFYKNNVALLVPQKIVLHNLENGAEKLIDISGDFDSFLASKDKLYLIATNYVKIIKN